MKAKAGFGQTLSVCCGERKRERETKESLGVER